MLSVSTCIRGVFKGFIAHIRGLLTISLTGQRSLLLSPSPKPFPFKNYLHKNLCPRAFTQLCRTLNILRSTTMWHSLSPSQPLKSRTGLQKISARYFSLRFRFKPVVFFSSFVSMYSIWLVVCRPGVVPFGLLPFRFSFILCSRSRVSAKNSIPSPPRHVVLCAVFRHLAASRLSLALPTGIASHSSPLLLAYLLWQSRHFSRRCRQGAVRRQGAACYVCEPCVGKLLGRVSAMNYRVLASNWALFRQRFGPRVGRILRRVSTRTWAMCRQRIYEPCVGKNLSRVSAKNFWPCVGKELWAVCRQRILEPCVGKELWAVCRQRTLGRVSAKNFEPCVGKEPWAVCRQRTLSRVSAKNLSVCRQEFEPCVGKNYSRVLENYWVMCR